MLTTSVIALAGVGFEVNDFCSLTNVSELILVTQFSLDLTLFSPDNWSDSVESWFVDE